jgi:tetratricopeptide (TPR) repeat protein
MEALIMCVGSRIIRCILLLVSTLAISSPVRADKQTRLMSRLDDLTRDIATAREMPAKIDTTIEDLRKELLKSAVETRDAKKLSDEIEAAIASGSPSAAELARLRTDIVNAGRVLRELRDQLDELTKINKASYEMMENYESQIASIRKGVIDPDSAVVAAGEEIVKELKTEVKNLKAVVAEKDRAIEKLQREGTVTATSNGKKQAEKSAEVDRDPTLVSAIDLLAAGKIDDALASFKVAYSLNPEALDPLIGIAACHFERGELEQAESIVDNVLEEDGRNPRALGLRGAILFRQGKAREAGKILAKAVRADSENPYNHNYLGITLNELGKSKAAIKEIERAVELDPNYISALYNLAILLATEDEPDLVRSRANYEKALSLGSPRNKMLDEILGLK